MVFESAESDAFAHPSYKFVETVIQEGERIVGIKSHSHSFWDPNENFQFVIAKGFDLVFLQCCRNRLSGHLLFAVQKYL